MTATAQIGVTGLGVMGRNLARNFARHGYAVALHNRTTARTTEVVDNFGDEGTFVPATTSEEFVASLIRPRRLVIMVNAGPATDAVIDEFAPLLEPGDMIRLETRRGAIEVKVRADNDVPVGMVFMPFCYAEAAANLLTNPALDPFGKIPEFKFCAVRAERAEAALDTERATARPPGQLVTPTGGAGA